MNTNEDNGEAVLAAVQRDGWGLKYASERIRAGCQGNCNVFLEKMQGLGIKG